MTTGLRRIAAYVVLMAVSAASSAAAVWLAQRHHDRPMHFADARDGALVLRGHAVYAARCANCHGRHLEGQPMWQLADRDSWRRAPAQDWTGHTWLHSDADLFHMVKFGRFAYARPDAPSAMPAFGDALADDEVVAVIAFIKSRWTAEMRSTQAALTFGGAGMPASVAAADWKFRALCTPRAEVK